MLEPPLSGEGKSGGRYRSPRPGDAFAESRWAHRAVWWRV